MTEPAPPSDPEGEGGEVVEVGNATQVRPRAAASSEPLLDRWTKFWLWMLGLAVVAAIAAIVVGLYIG